MKKYKVEGIREVLLKDGATVEAEISPFYVEANSVLEAQNIAISTIKPPASNINVAISIIEEV